jgi:hypothetical protein
MRMMFSRKLLLIWMILWLPFAGAMAAVMPIAGTSLQAAATVDDTQSVADAASSSDEFVMPCHSKSSVTKSSLGQTCTHCVLCHLAGALALGTVPVMPKISPTHIFAAAPLTPHPSFVPDLLSPPPRASLA